MKAGVLFALAALFPAAAGTGPAPRTIIAKLCSSGGAAQTVTIPLDRSLPGSGGENAPCCAKGCHAGGSRKRFRAQ